MSKTITILGSYGTVGLAVKEFLAPQTNIKTLEIGEHSKDFTHKDEAIALSDLVVLCLPSSVVEQEVSAIRRINPNCKILDTSTKFRCKQGWLYGLPELTGETIISNSQFVANPGCFATACILTGLPLKSFNQKSNPFVFTGFTGYTARGKRGMHTKTPELVQFGEEHKHIREIEEYLRCPSVLTTTVGNWERGLLLQMFIPAPHSCVLNEYQGHYKYKKDIEIITDTQTIDPQVCNGTNKTNIYVGRSKHGTVVSTVLDNLGRGAASAAVNNIKLMLSSV